MTNVKDKANGPLHSTVSLYLVPWQLLRSMSSSGVDSMMAWTSDFSRLSIPSGETDEEWTYRRIIPKFSLTS